MRTLLTSLSVVVYGLLQAQPATIYLHDNWEFAKSGVDYWSPATVPGYVHQDLLDNKLIEHPYYGNNAESQEWIAREDWNYRTTFQLDADFLNHDFINLRFEGIDTYACVVLNDDTLWELTDNMFLAWEANVKELLVTGNNTLEVHFFSPITIAGEKANQQDYSLPGDEYATGDIPSGMYTRKAAYQYGWDWAPRVVSSGLWQPVKLVGWNTARIADVNVTTQSVDAAMAAMSATFTLDAQPGNYQLLLTDSETENIWLRTSVNVPAGQYQWDFSIPEPTLWWPNGSGDPYLYSLTFELYTTEGELLDSQSVKVGVRTVELINEPDSIGDSFYFKVNGEPLFVKGANYVPQDVFPTNVTNGQYEDLIEFVAHSNMNMLRVWGGGIYESDLFYDLCDEHGIMVWQDFMFANAMYPADADFSANVGDEVVYQLNRLQHHPAIVLWCGNNEIEVAWNNWGWQDNLSATTVTSLETAYDSLFKFTIPGQVQACTPGTPYISTSPLSNWGTPENFNHANMHYWGVWHGNDDLSGYKLNVPRFMTEYGFQSYPGIATLQPWMQAQDLNLESIIMQHRQKSYVGNGKIEEFATRYFHEPTDFEDLVYLSQLTQQLAMKKAIEAHRANKGQCMGTMFWQLNDCWPGPSWSVVDYEGGIKAAGFMLQDAYRTTSVIIRSDSLGEVVYFVNDSLSALTGTFDIVLHAWDGTVKMLLDRPISVPANGIESVNITPLISGLGVFDLTTMYLEITWNTDSTVLDSDVLFFTDPSEMPLTAPEILIETGADGELVLTSNNLAYGVFLELPGFEFHNNYFNLYPGQPKSIRYTTEVEDPENDLLLKLELKSFY